MPHFSLASTLLLVLVSVPITGRGQAPASVGLPRLTGIVVSRDQRAALFETAPGTTVPAEEGERVGPYLVRSITAQEVRVEQEGRMRMLTVLASGPPPIPVDTGGVTFGLVVNPPGPPDD